MNQERALCENPKLYSPLVLAYMGDVVFEMMVREKLILQNPDMPVRRLHNMTVSHVCAAAQSGAIEALLAALTDDETEMFKRGRNANGSHVPKNANAQQYRRATGFETLFGYLYLMGHNDRIKELFSMIWTD